MSDSPDWYEVTQGSELLQGDLLRHCPITRVRGLDSASARPGCHIDGRTGKGQSGMMTQTELEARLLAVEAALQEIQRRLATLPPTPHWLDVMSGSCKDDPAFAEVIALGRAFREAQPYPEDPGAPA